MEKPSRSCCCYPRYFGHGCGQWDETGKAPIGVRWVDINKGDKVHPEYRSRLVAKEINKGKRDALFAKWVAKAPEPAVEEVVQG